MGIKRQTSQCPRIWGEVGKRAYVECVTLDGVQPMLTPPFSISYDKIVSADEQMDHFQFLKK